jgi:hypothetical protein
VPSAYSRRFAKPSASGSASSAALPVAEDEPKFVRRQSSSALSGAAGVAEAWLELPLVPTALVAVTT